MSKLWTIISVVVGVFAASALLGWFMFRWGKAMDRANSEPRYRRRQIVLLAGVYLVSIVVGVSEVIGGNRPVWSLVFLPFPLLIVLFLLRATRQTKVPPQ